MAAAPIVADEIDRAIDALELADEPLQLRIRRRVERIGRRRAKAGR